MTPVAEQITPLHTDRVWKDMSIEFYLTFWSLNIYDLWVPSAAYEKQITTLKAQVAALEDNKELVSAKLFLKGNQCFYKGKKLKTVLWIFYLLLHWKYQM